MLNRNNRLHTNNQKHVYKEKKETTHERVGERKTYINNIEEKISTMYVYKMVTIPHVQEQCILERKNRKNT